MGVNEYFLAMGYAQLYTYYKKEVTPENITISFVREGKPVKLLKYFREHHFQITEPESGIYYIKKEDHIDMQIIVTKDLDESYIWLKSLSKKLTREDAVKLAGEAGKEQDPDGMVRIRSILDLVSLLNQNKDWMKEMKGMGAFRNLFKEEFEEKDNKIAEQSKEITEQSKAIAKQNKALTKKDKEIAEQSREIAEQSKEINKLRKENESGHAEINKLRKEIEELKRQINKIAVL